MKVESSARYRRKDNQPTRYANSPLRADTDEVTAQTSTMRRAERYERIVIVVVPWVPGGGMRPACSFMLVLNVRRDRAGRLEHVCEVQNAYRCMYFALRQASR